MSLDLKRDIYNDEVYQEDMIIILLYGQKPPPYIYEAKADRIEWRNRQFNSGDFNVSLSIMGRRSSQK